MGGTGGHLFPAQQLAERILNEGMDVLFLGKGLSSSKFFEKNSFDFHDISSATFSVKRPWSVFLGLIKILKGILTSYKLIIRYKPDYVVGFGSYYSLPVLLAGVLLRVDLVLHEQNVFPGKVNTLFSRFSKVVGLTFPDVYDALRCKKKEVVILSKPNVSVKYNTEISKEFYENRKVLLVFGGSLGSVAINKIFVNTLPFLVKKISCFSVIHLVGDNEKIDNIQNAYFTLGISALVKPFEKNMSFYFQIATLAICRAGAGTLQELVYYELPAIMIPYPYAYNHQEKNALFFQKNICGGLCIQEKNVDVLELSDIITDILSPSKLLFYKENLSKYKNSYEEKDFFQFINKSLN